MIYYKTVTKEKIFCQHAAVAQSVERRIGSAEVTGPIPVSSSWKSLVFTRLFIFVLQFVLYIVKIPEYDVRYKSIVDAE